MSKSKPEPEPDWTFMDGWELNRTFSEELANTPEVADLFERVRTPNWSQFVQTLGTHPASVYPSEVFELFQKVKTPNWEQFIEDLNERSGILETQRTGEPMSERIQRTRDIPTSGFGVIFVPPRGKPRKR